MGAGTQGVSRPVRGFYHLCLSQIARVLAWKQKGTGPVGAGGASADCDKQNWIASTGSAVTGTVR